MDREHLEIASDTLTNVTGGHSCAQSSISGSWYWTGTGQTPNWPTERQCLVGQIPVDKR